MPPPEAHRTLTPAQIAVLRRWVGEGAVYQEHWSFIAPRRPAVPAVRLKGWVRNPIDAFVLARLEKEGLKPSPEADRPELIRRVTYDLIGLPPAPEEVDGFVRDASPNAYEKVVDRLLASPRYGEHRAHYWLDAVRYADTHGIQVDGYRNVWPYRDYVIRSFNANKPFDQFAREQLAGDLLPPRSVDQIVASAFIRLGISSGEGGTIYEELAADIRRDRTETFGAVFMGMTAGCAVCHDHKFDPITQKDFYRLSAYFGNLKESAYNYNETNWAPVLRLPRPENRRAYNAVLARRAEVEERIRARKTEAGNLIAQWIGTGRPFPRPQAVSSDGLVLRLRLDEGSGRQLFNSAPGVGHGRGGEASPAGRGIPGVVTAAGGAPVWGEETWLWPAFRLTGTTRIELPTLADFERDQAFTASAWVRPHFEEETSQTSPYGVILGRSDARAARRGWELYLDYGAKTFRDVFYHGGFGRGQTPYPAEGRLSLRLIHRWPDDAIVVETVEGPLAPRRWTHVLAVYDGSGGAAGVRLYVDGRPERVRIVRNALRGTIRTSAPFELAREYPDGEPLKQPSFQDVRVYARALAPEEAARVAWEDPAAEIVRRPPASWTEDEWQVVRDFYFSRDPETVKLEGKLPACDRELDRLSEGGPYCLVAAEQPRPPHVHVLKRGVYSALGERVDPGVPHFLPPLPSDAPPNRLALADWVVSPKNPLTARVTVNRMWQELFGTGIVETPDDFGLVGARPSHPELLDWLAVDFRESGWNLKRFYKQVVMSATYRQSARATPALVERDPANRLLARGPRFRMDAEMIRDTALAVSGLLVERLGGPSVKPYQPPNVWEPGATKGSDTAVYRMDHGEALYRRSLYTFWKRMATMPNMDAFDAPVRDVSCTRRQRSNTPLQALVVMNDPQWLEAARVLGQRLVERNGTDEQRLDYLGRLVVARPWEPPEKAVLERAYRRFQEIYAGHPALASELIGVGESRREAGVAPSRLAPWMMVASAALNLNETLNK